MGRRGPDRLRRGAACRVIWVLTGICGIAALYQLVAILACLRRKDTPICLNNPPPVSILKPVRGITPDLTYAIQTHLEQNYPVFELLLGVREDEAGRLELTDSRVREVVCHTVTPNRKVGTLI